MKTFATLSLLIAAACFLAVAAVILTSPLAVAAMSAGTLGLLAGATAAPIQSHAHRTPVVIVRVAERHTPKVFELENGAGIVVFAQVDGKLTSRLYRNKAAA